MTASCDRWREPIAEVAAGGPVFPELRVHLGACSACRQALGDQQALQARIAGELKGLLSIVPSPDLLPRVREQASRRGTPWAFWLLPVAAGLALFVFSIGSRRPAVAPPAVRSVEARPASPVPVEDAPRASAKRAASVERRLAARLPARRDPPALANDALPPIPDVEPVRPAALVIAPLDALPPIEPRPLVTVGLDFEGADR